MNAMLDGREMGATPQRGNCSGLGTIYLVEEDKISH
jgi:hypothetical protein